MKKITTITLLSFLTCVSIAQTASDYYLPLCVNNETVLYTPAGLPPAGWAERITRHTFIQTDSIGGELYYLEKGTEYSTGSSSFPPHTFKLVWLKQDVNGEILFGAYSEEYPILDSAIILPTPAIWFSNNFLTAGYSLTQSNGVYNNTDTVISTSATFGGFNNCIQIRSIRDSAGLIQVVQDAYYAFGIGLVGGERTFPTTEIHTDNLVSSFVTGCDPIVDTLQTAVVDTCFGQYFEYYIKDILDDTINNILTVTWVFQDGPLMNQFTESYNYQIAGNNVIGITINCSFNITSTTFYKTVFIGSTSTGLTEQPNLIGNLYIYPNPASYQITVETPAELVNARLNIYNQIGEVVYTDVLNGKKVTLSTEYLKSGIYFVYISDGQHIYTQKLILE
ncbi:MAG: T9SS type A sorting domain-containing protein [Bacteroidetes bacterium]|jgi:hypothetical protein|nr:T9SS type A sorting domain-containing protein [Bacteroidota bacterium]